MAFLFTGVAIHVDAVGARALANLDHLRAIATDDTHLHIFIDFDQLDTLAKFIGWRVSNDYI